MSSSYLKIPTKNKVEECRVLGGIDTLYFFVDTARSELYHKIWSLVLNEQFIRELLVFKLQRKDFWFRRCLVFIPS